MGRKPGVAGHKLHRMYTHAHAQTKEHADDTPNEIRLKAGIVSQSCGRPAETVQENALHQPPA